LGLGKLKNLYPNSSQPVTISCVEPMTNCLTIIKGWQLNTIKYGLSEYGRQSHELDIHLKISQCWFIPLLKIHTDAFENPPK